MDKTSYRLLFCKKARNIIQIQFRHNLYSERIFSLYFLRFFLEEILEIVRIHSKSYDKSLKYQKIITKIYKKKTIRQLREKRG